MSSCLCSAFVNLARFVLLSCILKKIHVEISFHSFKALLSPDKIILNVAVNHVTRTDEDFPPLKQ